MPGERLVCIWQAASTRNLMSNSKHLTKTMLHDIVMQLSALPTISFSSETFDKAFNNDDNVDVVSVKRYLLKELSTVSHQSTVQDEVEDKCWQMCKSLLKCRNLSQINVKKLWQIFNRLAKENSFPPVILDEVTLWFHERICSFLGKDSKLNMKHKATSYTIVAFLGLLDDLFSQEKEAKISKCVDTMHSWIVCEVLMEGWMYRRSRQISNWTKWNKRWFVLSSTSLVQYDSPTSRGKKKGELFLAGAKLETSIPDTGVEKKYQQRFKLSNGPFTLVELSPAASNVLQAWLDAIEDAIENTKVGTTAVQTLLASIEGNSPNKSQLQITATGHDILQKANGSSQSQSSEGSHDEEGSGCNDDNTDIIKQNNDKMKAVFMKIDTNGNGKIDESEFKEFLHGLGLKSVTDKEINMMFKAVDKDSSTFLTFQEFSAYFANIILADDFGGETEAKLRGAFLRADRDGTGTLNFQEFAEYLSEQKRSISAHKLLQMFSKMDFGHDGQVSFDEFREFYKSQMGSFPEVGENYKEGEDLTAVDRKLKDMFNEAETGELAEFIHKRWNKFASFQRRGSSGEIIMKGAEGMVDDIVPGEYSLLDLALFSDLPPLVPKHTVVNGVKWMSSDSPGKSGKVVFPSDFDGRLVTDTATPEHLRYYGCSFAEGNQLKISLLYRHGIQDFTYENKYLEDYVTLANGGSGIERHEFSHLDCPFEEDCGTFVLAKFVGDDELHLTGFRVPVRHTLYVPGGVIHSNDYLKGTWRTMLSDEADIDHVHLVQPPTTSSDKDTEHFTFEFVHA